MAEDLGFQFRSLNLDSEATRMVESEAQQLPVEDPEKKKKREEKAREKELKKLKAAQKAEAARLQAQQESNTSKVAKRKNLKKEGGEENPEDYVDPETSFGEKKRLSCQMAKQFNPSSVENSWYVWWEKSGYFVADSSSSKLPFVIVLLPPNVTGALHIGHALSCAIQDTIIRRRRMSGYNALWVPGVDHAGIATQMVIDFPPSLVSHLRSMEVQTAIDFLPFLKRRLLSLG